MAVGIALFLVCLATGNLADAASPSTPRTLGDWIQWQKLPSLPEELGVAGAYVGVSNQAIVVAGGSNFPVPYEAGGEKAYRDAIYVLEPQADTWRKAGPLPRKMAYGATANFGDRMICLGGRNESHSFDDVFALVWNVRTQQVEIQVLPPLPQPCYELSAATIDQTVYVVAGRDDVGSIRRMWRLQMGRASSDSRAWVELPAYPGPARFGAIVVAQNDGDQPCLYVIGGKDGPSYLARVDCFAPSDDNPRATWKRCADLPRPAYLAAAAPWGQSHLFLFGGSTGERFQTLGPSQQDIRFPKEVLAYHTITDTWVGTADVPEGLAATTATAWNGGLAIPGGETSPGQRTPECYLAKVLPTASAFSPLDYFAVAAYLLTVSLVALYCSGKNRNTEDYFLGGRRIPWWAAGLSLLATQVSSIGVVAIPAKSFATNWVYLTGVLAWFVVVPIVSRLFIPFYRRLEVTSAYEYLEARFSPSVRLFASSIYCLLQLGRMAVVLYLPALAVASVTEIGVIPAVLVTGALCTIYTVAGGMRAVIWTEVLQAAVLVGGMLLCFAVVLWKIGNTPSDLIEIARRHQKFQMVHADWDAFHAAIWVVLVGNIFIRLSNLTSDQAVVQRYLVTRDEHQSRMALWTDVAVSIPWALLVFSLGTALFVFYRANPQLLSPGVNVDGIVPYFIAQQLPSGISGIVVAAIMAAAMSTMESSMHSIATLVVTDFYSRWRPAAREHARLWIAKGVTLLTGVFGTASAVVLALANVHSLWDFFQYLMGLFVGSLAGLFLLGVFTTRANSRGVLVGALMSAVVMTYVTRCTQIHFLLYSAIGVMSCFGVGYVASLLIAGRRATAGLTAFSFAATE